MNTKHPAKRVVAANLFGTLGYISAIFQWAWALLLLCYPLITERPEFLLPSTPPPVQSPVPEVVPALAPIVTVIAIIATLLVLVMTIVVLARLPRAVGKKAAILTKTAANAAIPIVTHNKKITKLQRKKLSYRLSLAVKFLIITLPFGLLYFVNSSAAIPPVASWTVGLFCAALSLVYFVIQQIIAAVGKVDRGLLW